MGSRVFLFGAVSRHGLLKTLKSASFRTVSRSEFGVCFPSPDIWSGVWRSQHPLPPPQWYELVGGRRRGGGAGVCGEGRAGGAASGQDRMQALRRP